MTCTALAPGSFATSVTVKDALGESVSTSTFLQVSKSISAVPFAIPAAAICGQIPSWLLVANATGGTGAISAYWQFGDGSTGSGLSANHSYLSAGLYSVAVNLTDMVGGAHTARLQVNVSADSCGSTSPQSVGPNVIDWVAIGVIAALAVAVVVLFRRRSRPTSDVAEESEPSDPVTSENDLPSHD